tara:strand:- start:35619 stop:36821 length:1203 start_codon:yes stop_codon:yes gene_type:complete
MISVAKAERLILENIEFFSAEKISLEKAIGLALREDIFIDRDYPPYNRVTMDGFAISYVDWKKGLRSFEIKGSQPAGKQPLKLTNAGESIEVMTGSVIPDNADTIIPIERIQKKNNNRIEILGNLSLRKGQFTHKQGSDIRSGKKVLEKGIFLKSPEIAILASAGFNKLSVAKIPKIAIISNGDELVEVADKTNFFQIRSANDRAIEASILARRIGKVSRYIIKDKRKKILEKIIKLHSTHDMVILTGGVSMGRYDFVPGILEELKIDLVFHGISQRPGRPMWFGMSKESKPIFALPGNPVSTMVCMNRFIVPALNYALSTKRSYPEKIVLKKKVMFSPNLTYFVPVITNIDNNGIIKGNPITTNTSGDFISLANTDGFAELKKGSKIFKKGYSANLYRW